MKKREKKIYQKYFQIIKYKYEQEGNPNRSAFQTKIELFNDDMSKILRNEFTNGLNSVIGKLHDKNTLQVYLNLI